MVIFFDYFREKKMEEFLSGILLLFLRTKLLGKFWTAARNEDNGEKNGIFVTRTVINGTLE